VIFIPVCLSVMQQQIERPALDCDEEERLAYQLQMLQYSADQLVFADESAFFCSTTTRLMGWARSGQRSRRREYVRDP
jgi:hypothetical protein